MISSRQGAYAQTFSFFRLDINWEPFCFFLLTLINSLPVLSKQVFNSPTLVKTAKVYSFLCFVIYKKTHLDREFMILCILFFNEKTQYHFTYFHLKGFTNM